MYLGQQLFDGLAIRDYHCHQPGYWIVQQEKIGAPGQIVDIKDNTYEFSLRSASQHDTESHAASVDEADHRVSHNLHTRRDRTDGYHVLAHLQVVEEHPGDGLNIADSVNRISRISASR